jgi:hypothetical protein
VGVIKVLQSNINIYSTILPSLQLCLAAGPDGAYKLTAPKNMVCTETVFVFRKIDSARLEINSWAP